jgi:hypothetical protein
MTTTGFSVLDKTTGKKLATLPLTIPIGSTVEGFQRAGYEVTWTWEKGESNNE